MSIFEPVKNYHSEMPYAFSLNQSKASLDNHLVDPVNPDVSVDETNKSMDLSTSRKMIANGNTNESQLERLED